MNWTESVKALAKCIAGESVSEEVKNGRLAVCSVCPSARVYGFGIGALVTCGQLNQPTEKTCGCILGAVTPIKLTQIRMAFQVERRSDAIKDQASPLCKTTVASESCPQGKWLGISVE